MMEYRISGNLNVISIEYSITPQRHYIDWEPSQSNAEYFDFHGHSICEECGQDHGFKPTFDDVKTSIDVIAELLEKIETWERRGPFN